MPENFITLNTFLILDIFKFTVCNNIWNRRHLYLLQRWTLAKISCLHCHLNSKAQYIYLDIKLLVAIVYFVEPVQTSLWAIWAEQHAQYTSFLL